MSSISKDEILQAIRFQAAQNEGVALGKARFEAATGIRESSWKGKYWAFWNDALVEAGFEPNSWAERVHDDEGLVQKLADLALELGHYPAEGERGMKHQADRTFPHSRVFPGRLGNVQAQLRLLMEFAVANPGYEAVFDMCSPLVKATPDEDLPVLHAPSVPGRVYLVYSHSLNLYKIGESDNPKRRLREIQASVPGQIEEIHVLETDDPAGIEQYWHRRFRDLKRINEWFDLSKNDVEAFRSRGSSM
jgi:hypothetical protein